MSWTEQQFLDASPLSLQQYKNGLTPGDPEIARCTLIQNWKAAETAKVQVNTNRLKNGFAGATGLETPTTPPPNP